MAYIPYPVRATNDLVTVAGDYNIWKANDAYFKTVTDALLETVSGYESIELGTAFPYYGLPTAVPTGYLLCDGQFVSMTDYEDLITLFGLVSKYYGTDIDAAFTYDVATRFAVTANTTPNTLSAAGHPLSADDILCLSSTTTLPSPFDTSVPYYVVNPTTNDFQLALTEGGAAIDITDTGTGTHYANVDFGTPDLRGRVFAGLDAMITGSPANVVTDASADAISGDLGAETHTLVADETPTAFYKAGALGGGGIQLSTSGTTHSPTGGGNSHNNMQPSQFGNWIIKT